MDRQQQVTQRPEIGQSNVEKSLKIMNKSYNRLKFVFIILGILGVITLLAVLVLGVLQSA